MVDSVVAFEDTFFELLSTEGLGVGEVIGTSADSIRVITRLLTESQVGVISLLVKVPN